MPVRSQARHALLSARGLAPLACLALLALPACRTSETPADPALSAGRDYVPALVSESEGSNPSSMVRLAGLEEAMASVAREKVYGARPFPTAHAPFGATLQGDVLWTYAFDTAERVHVLHKLNARDGSSRWITSLGDAKPIADPAIGSRLAVVMQKGGEMRAFLSRNGAHVGERMVANAGHISLIGTPLAGTEAVFAASLLDQRIHALDPDTGVTGWAFRSPTAIAAAPIMTPSVPGALIVWGTEGGKVHAIAPSAARGGGPSETTWSADVLGPVSGPLGIATRELEDGRTEASVLVPSEDGGLYCLDATGGEARWVFRTETAFIGVPRCYGGVVFARNGEGLQAIDLETGLEAYPTMDWAARSAWSSFREAIAGDDECVYLRRGTKITRISTETGAVLAQKRLSTFDEILVSAPGQPLMAMTLDGYLLAWR